jgi:hypothetical protein
MKRLLLYLLCIALLAACSKDEEPDYQATGTITGSDFTMTPCSEGVFFKFDNNAAIYRIKSLPGMTSQQLHNLPFPQKIQLNYTSPGSCGVPILEVSQFILQ